MFDCLIVLIIVVALIELSQILPTKIVHRILFTTLQGHPQDVWSAQAGGTWPLGGGDHLQK